MCFFDFFLGLSSGMLPDRSMYFLYVCHKKKVKDCFMYLISLPGPGPKDPMRACAWAKLPNFVPSSYFMHSHYSLISCDHLVPHIFLIIVVAIFGRL